MRRLWGRANSVNVQKVLWALDEAGLSYERIDAGGAHGIVHDPAYRALNPNGLVPTLEEDGFVLWESNAILRHLARSCEALRPPADLREQAQIDQWLDWQTGSYTAAMRDAFWQLYRVPASERDHARVAASLAATETHVAVLDAHLSGRDHVVGRGFTIADIALGCAAHRWLNLPAERIERPALRRWYDRLAARPGAARTLAEPIS